MKYISKLIIGVLLIAIIGGGVVSADVRNRDVALGVDLNFEKLGTANFTPLGVVTLSKQPNEKGDKGERVLRVAVSTGTGSVYAYANQKNVFEVGKTYRVRGLVRADASTTTCRIISYTAGAGVAFSTQNTTWTPIDVLFTPNSSTLSLSSMQEIDVPAWCEFDNISITPYYGEVRNRDVNILKNGKFENGGGELDSFSTTETVIDIDPSIGSSKALRVECTGASCNYSKGILGAIGTYRATGCIRSSDPTQQACVARGTSDSAIFCTTSTSFVCFDELFTTQEANAIYSLRPASGVVGHYGDFTMLSVQPYYGEVRNRERQVLVDGNMEAPNMNAFDTTGITAYKEWDEERQSQVVFVQRGTVPVLNWFPYPLTIGKTYRIRGYMKGGVGGLARVYNLGVIVASTTSTDWVYFDEIFVAGSERVGLWGGVATGVSTAYYDNISITELY